MRTSVVLDVPHAKAQFDDAPRAVRKALRRKAARLEEDPQHGTFVALARIPSATLGRWQRRVGPFKRVYKVNLPGAWRAIYTVRTEEDERFVLVLEIVDHTTYDRLLGYG